MTRNEAISKINSLLEIYRSRSDRLVREAITLKIKQVIVEYRHSKNKQLTESQDYLPEK